MILDDLATGWERSKQISEPIFLCWLIFLRFHLYFLRLFVFRSYVRVFFLRVTSTVGSHPPSRHIHRRVTYTVGHVHRKVTSTVRSPPPSGHIQRRATSAVGSHPPSGHMRRRVTFTVGSNPPSGIRRRVTSAVGSHPPSGYIHHRVKSNVG